MLNSERPYNFDRVFRLALAGAMLWGLIWLLSYLSDVLLPFALGLLLAYLLNPLVELWQRLVKNRVVAVFVSLGCLVLAAVLLLWLVVPMIAAELANMGRLLSQLTSGSSLAEKASGPIPAKLMEWVRDILARPEVKSFFSSGNLWDMGLALAKKILPGLWGLVSQVGSFVMGLIGLLMVGLYFIFLLLDFEAVAANWQEILPPSQRERVAGFLGEFQTSMSRYFRAQAGVAAIVGVLFAIGFSLIGLPLGILLGLFMGVLNMVPYLQLLGLIPAIMMAVLATLQGDMGIWAMLGLTGGVFAAVQVIQDTFLVPKIMGKAMGLSPAFILLSLSVWGKLLGFLGLIIAIPLTCLLWAWYQKFVCKTDKEPEPESASA
jgi:predicted PurR-regulated permease PerM